MVRSAHLGPQVGHGPLDLGGDVLLGPLLDLGHLGLGLLLEVLAELVGRLAGLLDDAGRLVLGVGQLALVLLEDARWPRRGSSRPRRGCSRILSARASMPFFTAGKANLAMRKKRTTNESAPQMISLVAGRIGLVVASSSACGASWAKESTAVSRFMAPPLGELEEDEDARTR